MISWQTWYVTLHHEMSRNACEPILRYDQNYLGGWIVDFYIFIALQTISIFLRVALILL